MQKAHKDFSTYLSHLEKTKKDGPAIGAVVLNANPFTLGHKYLVEYASKNSTYLHIFVVSEDESFFSAKNRYKMVEEGVGEFINVIIHHTDNYLVSSATFPSYFIDEEKSVTKIHATLDAKIFKYHIAKTLGIDKRFVGTEPNDEATRIYNETMREVFESEPWPDKLKLIEIPRKELNGKVISASLVRKLIKDENLEKTKDLLVPTTYEYIKKLSL